MNTPASPKVKVNDPPWANSGDAIGPPCTVWRSASKFVHVTESPTPTCTSEGRNADPRISTPADAAPARPTNGTMPAMTATAAAAAAARLPPMTPTMPDLRWSAAVAPI